MAMKAGPALLLALNDMLSDCWKGDLAGWGQAFPEHDASTDCRKIRGTNWRSQCDSIR